MKKLFIIINVFIVLTSLSTITWARSECQCYLMGKTDGRAVRQQRSTQGDNYQLPEGCGYYISSPMKPYRGGYFDGKASNRDSLNKSTWR
ncbi:MAG: hypothetical protein ACI9D5_000559 [Candidatus Endobugula sp.]|jgi:hypothetical protein